MVYTLFPTIGGYLYRFPVKPDNLTQGLDDVCKGLPIPIDSILSVIIEDDQGQEITSESTRKSSFYMIILKTLRKTYKFRVFTNEEAQQWRGMILQRKYLYIKESMGHSEIPELVKVINQRASKLYDKKLVMESNTRKKEYEENMAMVQNPIR